MFLGYFVVPIAAVSRLGRIQVMLSLLPLYCAAYTHSMALETLNINST